MQLFSADAIKKNFDPENCPQKLLTIGPQLFFSVLARLPKRPKTEILYPQKPLNAGLGI